MRGISVVKNSFGISCITSARICHPDKIGQFGGSALNRTEKTISLRKLLSDPLSPIEPDQKEDFGLGPKPIRKKKLRSMSPRTKAKIRKKVIAFSMVCPKLTFLTLTFCNKVEDQEAIKIFRGFIDNAKKRLPELEYLWVVERQV